MPPITSPSPEPKAVKTAGFPDIVVFSHLRWEFVIQRPQHLIGRMARKAQVLFVEEPIGYESADYGTAHTYSPAKNITVLQPRMPSDEIRTGLASLVQKQMNSMGMEQPALWFYSASFSPVLEDMDYSLLIYDCMDELSAFRGAPPALIEQEKQLLNRADLVFTGGKSLYEAKQTLAKNIYCYPSSVDRQHFEKALQPDTDIPHDLAAIPGPVIGYYGVIDERIDYDLLDAAARHNPAWSFVMIGPIVKVAQEELPRHPNLHYLGGKAYTELPAYLKGFDVAMMPFALNESTRFISPTKTLEYIAGQKPVVSTAIYDVVRDYSEVIPIAGNSESFSAAIRQFLKETPAATTKRLQHYEAILQAVSWDKTAQSMQQNIIDQFSNEKATSNHGN